MEKKGEFNTIIYRKKYRKGKKDLTIQRGHKTGSKINAKKELLL